jgi:5-(carboxyamino)imidazole ribonucleotide mutase
MIQIILGSKSDEKIGERVCEVLKKLGIKHRITVASAHRTPEKVIELAKSEDVRIFIAVAGLSANLPGMVASHTHKPVIGVPVNVSLGGMDSLLSIVQSPPGIPVACVGIDRGENAALLAAEIISLQDERVREKLKEYREEMRKKVEKDAGELKWEA